MREIPQRAISIICEIYEHQQKNETKKNRKNSQAKVSGIWDNFFWKRGNAYANEAIDHYRLVITFGIPFEFMYVSVDRQLSVHKCSCLIFYLLLSPLYLSHISISCFDGTVIKLETEKMTIIFFLFVLFHCEF